MKKTDREWFARNRPEGRGIFDWMLVAMLVLGYGSADWSFPGWLWALAFLPMFYRLLFGAVETWGDWRKEP